MSFYDVLGVGPGATQEDIQQAYRAMAKQFHPDQHPGAPELVRRQFEQAMARVNEAYNVLKDAQSRSEYDRWLASGEQQPILARPPHADECLLCGFYGAEKFVFKHQIAWIIASTQHTVEATLCRTCATAFGRSKQNRTLYTGWWGLFAFFLNIGAVWQNSVALRRAQKLPQPRPRDDIDAVVVPLARPLDPGRPLLGRGGIWVTAAAVTFLLLAGAATEDPEPTTIPSAGLDLLSVTWAVGNCYVESGADVYPVACDESHDGRVVDRAITESRCPASADYWVRDSGWVFCLMDT